MEEVFPGDIATWSGILAIFSLRAECKQLVINVDVLSDQKHNPGVDVRIDEKTGVGH